MQKSNKQDVKFRFAPSPTGGLHIGTARTALFNWIAAKSMGGKLVLRIEDTDIKRSSRDFENSIIGDLKWLGLDWDEFYRQSERLALYLKEAKRLLDNKKAYRCFCTPERLESLKQSLIQMHKPTGYDGRCRNLTEEEIAKNILEKNPFTIRYRVEPGEILFHDLIRGDIRFSSTVISDFVLIKSDGTPSYNFAVVIDDNDMNITHVLRGEDHITNTARQIMLFKSLGYKLPEFAHLSMIFGKDGAKLSKRHGATTITQFRKEGYLKESIVNYLSLLSWAPKNGEEIFVPENILDIFRLQDISKNPAIFDIEKLNWINASYIKAKSDKELKKLLEDFMPTQSWYKNVKEEKKLLKLIDAFKEKIKTLKEFPPLAADYFNDEINVYEDDSIEILKNTSAIKVLDLFELKLQDYFFSCGDNIEEENAKELIKTTSKELKKSEIKGRQLYMPIRAGITGITHGPELPKIISILGTSVCIKRIKQTKIFIENYNNI